MTDYFGKMVDKQDFDGRDYNFIYNAAGWLTQRTSGSGETITYSYYNSGKLKSTSTIENSLYVNSSINAIYAYDIDGNRTNESYYTAVTFTYQGTPYNYTTTHQNSVVQWDALNRMTSYRDEAVAGKTVSINWQYDANSNIRHMVSSFYALDNMGVPVASPTVQDYWYKYDSMNRFVTTQGALSGGIITRGLTGTDLTYNAAGQRISAARTIAYSGYQQTSYEQYSYDLNGYLATVRSGTSTGPGLPSGAPANPTSTTLRVQETRNVLGFLTNHTEYLSDGTTVAFKRDAAYENNGQLISDNVQQRTSSGTYQYVKTTYNYKLGAAFQGGAVISSVAEFKDAPSFDPPKYTQTTTNTYGWWDGAVLTSSNIVTTGAISSNFTTTYNYNTSGYLTRASIQDGRPRNVSYVTDAYGQILVRDEDDSISPNAALKQLYYYFNGLRVGDVGNNGSSNTDYVTAISDRIRAQGTGPFRFGATTSTSYADFDQSYDAINPGSQGGAAQRYTVRDGDTLQTIASAIWGDASLWYMIADANGLNGTENLQAGLTLSIPDRIANVHNNASTFRPYDPNKAIGDTSPTTPATPPPPKKPGCGVLGIIILIAIAVAVVAIAGPAIIGAPAIAGVGGSAATGLTAVFGGAAAAAGSAATIGAGIVGGALAGALGSIVSQGIGVATRLQDKFSWKGVAMAAIAGGVGGGLGGSGILGRVAGSPFLGGVARGALGSVVSQGIGVATRLQSSFNWTAVASAGIGAGVGGTLGLKGIEGKAVSGMAGGIAGAAAEALVTGNSFGDTLMASLPSIIGNTIGNLVAGGIGTAFDGKSGSSKNTRQAAGGKQGNPNVADNAGATNGGNSAGQQAVVAAVQNQQSAQAAADEIVVTGSRHIRQDMNLVSAGQLKTILDEEDVHRDPSRTHARLEQAIYGGAAPSAFGGTSLSDVSNRYFGKRSFNLGATDVGANVDYVGISADILIPAHAANNASIANFNQGNYLTSAGYFLLGTAELALTGLTLGGGNLPLSGMRASSLALEAAAESAPSRFAQGVQFEASGTVTARAEAFVQGGSTQRLSVRAFDDAGNLLPGRTVLDQAGSRLDNGAFGALEFKLSSNAPYTARQLEHFPYLAKNGGVVVGTKGESIGLPAGTRLPAFTPNRINGPTLPGSNGWWPQ